MRPKRVFCRNLIVPLRSAISQPGEKANIMAKTAKKFDEKKKMHREKFWSVSQLT